MRRPSRLLLLLLACASPALAWPHASKSPRARVRAADSGEPAPGQGAPRSGSTAVKTPKAGAAPGGSATSGPGVGSSGSAGSTPAGSPGSGSATGSASGAGSSNAASSPNGAGSPSATGAASTGAASPLSQGAQSPAPPGSATQPRPAQPAPPAIPPRRFGRFDLDQPLAALRVLPDLKGCDLSAPAGHADCPLPGSPDKLERLQVAWEGARPGNEVIALRLVFDPLVAPALTDLEWQLTRGWGPPVLEQLRREKDQKIFTLQWEDAEHRATLEAAGPLAQPSRAVAVTLERRQIPLSGDLAGLHPRPFPGFRTRYLKRVDWDGVTHVVLWGTNLSPAQEAMGETSPQWAAQRNYVAVWRLDLSGGPRSRRWKALWERETGGDEDDEAQRVLLVDARDVTGDGTPDIEIELSCDICGPTASEVIVKTVRAGKLVDLLVKRELYRAQVEMGPGQVRIREPEGEDDQGTTVSTYSYDRGKGAFVLAREERLGAKSE